MKDRTKTITRQTKETFVRLTLGLDGHQEISIQTGIPFFDHMLKAMAFHAGFDLRIEVNGDLEVDTHHTVEDVGLVFGKAFMDALGDKRGIKRFGFAYVPMDDALSRVVVDLSGRPYLVFDANFDVPVIGTLETETIAEFMKSFAFEAKLNLHIETLYGSNNHHIAESIFKATGLALRQAVCVEGEEMPSTKGVL